MSPFLFCPVFRDLWKVTVLLFLPLLHKLCTDALAGKQLNENGLEYTTNEVIVGTGGKQCVCNAVLALVNPGDEVIIPAPYWVSYPQMVKLAGGTPVIVNAGFDQDFKMTAEQLENAITEKTKMLILCSPSNPTGSVYSKEELAALAEVLKKHPEVFVLADEIYEHINYIGKHHSIAQEPGMKEHVYNMGGMRASFLKGDITYGDVLAVAPELRTPKRSPTRPLT